MDNSTILSLPYILPAQAQKHVTHNEAIQMLDAIVQLSAEDISRTIPPTDPQDGQRHIVAENATGLWENKDHNVAVWESGGWRFFKPNIGWCAYIISQSRLMFFDGTQWVSGSNELSPASYERFSINTNLDTNHQLAVRGASTFLNADDSDHRLVINKSTSNATASMIFQSSYTGHAEMGLTGSNNFAFKVSADGTNFVDALLIDNSTGAVTMPQTDLGTSNTQQDSVKIGASFTNSGIQSVPTNQYTKINGWIFSDNELADSTFEDGVLTIGAQGAGRYIFGFTAVVKSTSASVAVRVRRNGNETIGHAQANGSGSLFSSASLASSVLLAENDQIEFQVWHSHGSSILIHNVSTASFARL